MAIEANSPDGLCEPPGFYCGGVRAGGTVYLAGQAAFDAWQQKGAE